MSISGRLVTSMCKVFPTREPGPVLGELCVLRGESLSFQLAYRWEGPYRAWGKVEVESKLPVRVREVGLVPCEYPCHPWHDEGYLATEPGLYPDLLREPKRFGIPLVAGQWRSVWLDVKTEGITAGKYPVTVRIVGEEGVLCEESAPVEILDMELPKLPIPHTEWFHSDCLADYYGAEVFSERWWEIVGNFVETAAEHRCNMLLTPVFTPPLDTAVGGQRRTVQLVDVEVTGEGYRFGFENFRRWVKLALDRGIEYIEISHLFSQWGAKAAPKVMGTEKGEYRQLFGWDTDGGGEEYTGFLRQFLRALKPVLEELGISGRTYFHISDEPSLEHMDSYKRAFEGVKEELAGYNMMDALSERTYYDMGLVQQPVCAIDHLEKFLADRPEKLWGYYCTGQAVDVPNRFIVQPGSRTRILGALLYKYELAGFLQWGYNFYNSQVSLYQIDPYRVTDAGGAFPSGDPFLVYPGPEGRPEESQRLLLMDEAMCDYCALYALEGLVGRERVMELVGEMTFKSYPDEAGLLEVRRRVNEEIKANI